MHATVECQVGKVKGGATGWENISSLQPSKQRALAWSSVCLETAEWGHSGHSGSRPCTRSIFFSRMMHTHVQRMSSWTSCMMCLVAISYRIDFHSASSVGGPDHHVYRTWIPAIISFGATSQIVCTPPTRTLFMSCKRKLKQLMKRSQVTRCVTKLKKIIVPRGLRISYWACAHMKITWVQTRHESELSFIFHVVLKPIKLRLYHTSKLACSDYAVLVRNIEAATRQQINRITSRRDDKAGLNKISLLLPQFVNCFQMCRNAFEFRMSRHTGVRQCKP